MPGGLAPGRWPDRVAVDISSIFISVPNVLLGIVLAMLVSVKLGWLLASGYAGFAETIRTAIVLAVELEPVLSRNLN
ncbi:ABC transporter permease, partial [Rhizobium leguminosarum]